MPSEISGEDVTTCGSLQKIHLVEVVGKFCSSVVHPLVVVSVAYMDGDDTLQTNQVAWNGRSSWRRLGPVHTSQREDWSTLTVGAPIG